VKVLYGTASPADALRAAKATMEPLDLDQFVRDIAAHAADAGIANVVYAQAQEPPRACTIDADAHWLEDVMSHLLTNAARHRALNSQITLSLIREGARATLTVHNQGAPIPDALLGSVFEYGVSSRTDPEGGQRGQGLYVVKTYLAGMGATVAIANVTDGVMVTMGFAVVE
jgi:two-component system, OmpR family, sensor kinase